MTSSSISCPAAGSSTLAANRPLLTSPTLSPKPRSRPRMLSSPSRSLVRNSLRPASSALISCAGGDSRCTGRYQPILSSWAMPRASLRSVSTTIAESAALTCRVPSSTASYPASLRPAWSHRDKGPASRPTRASGRPSCPKKATSASGSLATLASRTIRPVPSTTHTLLRSSETSIPAWCSTAVPRRCLGPTRPDPVHSSPRRTAASPVSPGAGPLRHLERDQAGDDHREPDRARGLPALPRREEEALGRRVLDRRLFREHRRPAREREGDRCLRQATRLGLPEACMGLSMSSVHRWHPGPMCRSTQRGRAVMRPWRSEGSSPSAARISRRELVFGGVPRDPDHDAAVRIGGEAPGRRAHSAPRLGGHASARVTATSDRHRPPSTAAWRGAETPSREAVRSSRSRRPQGEALRHLARGRQLPQPDQELPRQRHDQRLARAGAGVRGARPVPAGERAVLLVQQEAPGQLDHAPAHPGVAGPGEPLLPPPRPALVRRSRQAGVARHRPPVPQAAREDLVHQHVRRLDPDPDDPGQQAEHGVPPGRGLPLQRLEAGPLRPPVPVPPQPPPRPVAPQLGGGVWRERAPPPGGARPPVVPRPSPGRLLAPGGPT